MTMTVLVVLFHYNNHNYKHTPGTVSSCGTESATASVAVVLLTAWLARDL
jgi:hypothetical protein